MELHEIRYFLAVCETLNFTRAACRCNVGQPALTRAIQKLERELGGLLFSREGVRTHLTDLGRLMQPRLAEVQARAQEAGIAARRFTDLEAASLSMAVMCGIGPLHVVPFLQWFQQGHPGVAVTLSEGAREELVVELLDGRRDVAVLACPIGFDHRFHVLPLYREGFVAAVGTQHRLARQESVTAQDLDGEAYLACVACAWQEHLVEICRNHGARLAASYSSPREDWIQAMAAAGMGICFVPEFSPPCAGVVTRPMRLPPVTREVCLVTVAGRRWSAPLARLMAAVRVHPWQSLHASGALAAA